MINEKIFFKIYLHWWRTRTYMVTLYCPTMQHFLNSWRENILREVPCDFSLSFATVCVFMKWFSFPCWVRQRKGSASFHSIIRQDYEARTVSPNPGSSGFWLLVSLESWSCVPAPAPSPTCLAKLCKWHSCFLTNHSQDTVLTQWQLAFFPVSFDIVWSSS